MGAQYPGCGCDLAKKSAATANANHRMSSCHRLDHNAHKVHEEEGGEEEDWRSMEKKEIGEAKRRKTNWRAFEHLKPFRKKHLCGIIFT